MCLCVCVFVSLCIVMDVLSRDCAVRDTAGNGNSSSWLHMIGGLLEIESCEFVDNSVSILTLDAVVEARIYSY